MKSKKIFKPFMAWGLMAILTLGLIANMYNYFLSGMPGVFRPDVYAAHQIQLLCHIGGAIVAALAGLPQFLPNFRANHPKKHKIFGYLYISGIVVSAPAGLLMAFVSQGGLVTHIGFGILSILWAFTTFKALYYVIQGDVTSHKEWMIRSYALTFAFVTLRVWIGILMVINKGQNFEEIYQTVAWLCWVPNLLIVDYFIARKKSKQADKDQIKLA